MTPAQERAIAVALDGLREVGFDEARLRLATEALGDELPITLLRVGMRVRDAAARRADEHGGLSFPIHNIDVEAITRNLLWPDVIPPATAADRIGREDAR